MTTTWGLLMLTGLPMDAVLLRMDARFRDRERRCRQKPMITNQGQSDASTATSRSVDAVLEEILTVMVILSTGDDWSH
jgi:hypothetical protein